MTSENYINLGTAIIIIGSILFLAVTVVLLLIYKIRKKN